MTLSTLSRTALAVALLLFASGAAAQTLDMNGVPTDGRTADSSPASLAGPLGTFASGIIRPNYLTQLADGRVLVTASGADQVLAFLPDGTPLGAFGAGLNFPIGIAQLSNGNVLVRSGPDVVQFASDGTSLGTFASGFTNPNGVTQLADGRVLVSDLGAGVVYAYLEDGTSLGAFTAAVSSPTSIVELQTGTIVVMEADTGDAEAFDQTGASLGTFAAGASSGSSRAGLLSDGSILISDVIDGTVSRYASDGSFIETFATGFSLAAGLVQLADSRVLINDFGAGEVEAYEGPGTAIPNVTIDYLSSTANPQRGDVIFVRALATNNEAFTVRSRVYVEVAYPDGTMRTYSVLSKDFPANSSFQVQKVKRIKIPVPANAPAGTYTATLFIADDLANGGTIYDSDSFTYTLPPMNTKAGDLASAPEAGPNPFRTQTTIRYELSDDSEVDLRVFDVTGREVASLASGVQSAGVQSAVFAAADLPGGVYVWRLAVDGEVTTGRVTLAR